MSKQDYKYTIFQDDVKQAAYRYFCHKPTDELVKTEIKGIKVIIIRDVVQDRIYFTARFIWDGVRTEVLF